jgi:hypothetical protein
MAIKKPAEAGNEIAPNAEINTDVGRSNGTRQTRL